MLSTCKGDDLRSILNLELDNSKADVECVLVSISTRRQWTKNLSHTWYKTLAVFQLVRICLDALDCDP